MPELLIVLAIVGFLAVIALPALRDMAAAHTVTLAADRLAVSLALARTTAMSRRTEVRLGPPRSADTLHGGWQLSRVAGDHGASEPPFSVVALSERCLRITLRGTGGPAGPQSLSLTAVGYSRSERGGFFAATFQVRCRDAQRQVRLGAQGRIRICRPGFDVDCD